MTEEHILKTCPFCGCDARLVEDLYFDSPDIVGGGREPELDEFYVICKGCGIVPNGWGNSGWDSREDALKAWNKRV